MGNAVEDSPLLGNYMLQFSADVKKHKITTLTTKHADAILITSSVYIIRLKFTHAQAEVALMAAQFIHLEKFIGPSNALVSTLFDYFVFAN